MNTKIKSESSQKVLLIIRDGWGYSPETEYNMIAQANTSYTDYLEKTYPTTLLKASGEAVGLPEGYFGNSEVGHMTIGAGRALDQSLLRINKSISDGSFFENEAFLKAMKYAKKYESKLHLLGLLQKEGVHAHFDHLVALLELAKQQGFKDDGVFIHIIIDGRDAEKQNAKNYIIDLEKEIERIGLGKIVTLAGRYYAMDRNNHWDRVEKYYNILVGRLPEFISGSTIPKETFKDPKNYLKQRYQDTEFSDEFLEPIIYKGYNGITEHDVIIDFSFRKDRERQITRAFCDENFSEFKTHHKNIYFAAMTEYYEGLAHVAFPDRKIKNILGKILEENNKTQLRISETEKYAHVTFFFDGGEDYDFNGEQKIIIPSPEVAHYDERPEMSSIKISEKLIFEMQNNQQDFILCNFPNADMVGHTGNFNAIKKAIEAIDRVLEKIIPTALENDYIVMLAADHGNAEYKHDDFETSHTHNLIPFTLISKDNKYKNFQLKQNMSLENIAASILKMLDIEIPDLYKKPLC